MGMRPGNERRGYKVTLSLIARARAQSDPRINLAMMR